MHAFNDQHPGLTFARVLQVADLRAAGMDHSNDELLQLARARSLDPTIFDQTAPFFWPGEVSSDRWDSFDTRMGASTLKNYASELQAGVSFLRNHDSAQDPVGHSLTGRFINGGGDGIVKVRGEFFAVPSDPETSGYIGKIRAGVVRDLSVGFFSGEWICSLCQRDMQQWFGDDSCPHLLGMTYTPTDEAGTVKGPPEVARATIENAHLAEVSGVYDGSTPGAMIGKARALAVEGVLSERSAGLVETRYRCRLPSPFHRWSGVTLPVPSPSVVQPTRPGVPWDQPRADAVAPAVPAWARSMAHGG